MKTFIFGAGGHGRVVFDILKMQEISVDGFIDSNPKLSTQFGLPVLSESILPGLGAFRIIIALGANHVRREVVERIHSTCPQVQFFNAVHPTAYVSSLSKLGVGCVVAAGAIVTPNVTIGDHVVINTGAQVDHDCSIRDFATVAPGVVMGGTVGVNDGAYLGIGAVVKHGVNIGEWSVVGAGALVIENLPDFVLAYGSPCRVIRPRRVDEPYL